MCFLTDHRPLALSTEAVTLERRVPIPHLFSATILLYKPPGDALSPTVE